MINKKPINAHYSDLTESIKSNPEALKFKVNDRVRSDKYKLFLLKVILETEADK